MLLTHADTIDQVEMRIWYHCYLIVVLDVRESIAYFVHVDQITYAANRIPQSVLLQLAFEKALCVEDVEPGWIILEHRLPTMPVFYSQIGHCVRLGPTIVY